MAETTAVTCDGRFKYLGGPLGKAVPMIALTIILNDSPIRLFVQASKCEDLFHRISLQACLHACKLQE